MKSLADVVSGNVVHGPTHDDLLHEVSISVIDRVTDDLIKQDSPEDTLYWAMVDALTDHYDVVDITYEDDAIEEEWKMNYYSKDPYSIVGEEWVIIPKGRDPDLVVDISGQNHGPVAKVHVYYDVGPHGESLAHSVKSTMPSDGTYAYSQRPTEERIQIDWSK